MLWTIYDSTSSEIPPLSSLSLLTALFEYVYFNNFTNSWLGTEEHWLGLCFTSAHIDHATVTKQHAYNFEIKDAPVCCCYTWFDTCAQHTIQ